MQGTHCTGKTGKMAKTNLSGKTQRIWKCCQNTGNSVCASCKFPDSIGKRYFKKFQLKLDKSAKSSISSVEMDPGDWHACNLCYFLVGSGELPAGKTGKMANKIPCQRKHREFCQNTGKTQGILSKHRENTWNFVRSSCKCSDLKKKKKDIVIFATKKIIFFPEAG